MKFKHFSVLAGSAVAVTSMLLIPFSLSAQTVRPMSRPTEEGRPAPRPIEEVMEQLDLTAEQEARLAEIRDERRVQIAAILTEDQQAEFADVLTNGGSFPEAIAAINLSPEQQTELRAVFESDREQIAEILTDEQEAELHEIMGAHRPPMPSAIEEVMAELDLTPEQEAQLAAVHEEKRAQIEAILTDEQKTEFREALTNGGSLPEAIAAMDLDADQQVELRSVFDSVREQAAAILTEEQQAELRDIMQSRWQQQPR